MAADLSNYDVALKAEAKRVVRSFQPYSSETRANHAASHRLGAGKRQSVGELFYTHPDIDGVCFPSRSAAARAALSKSEA